MKKTYQTGIDTNQISLGVTVGTVGTAYTSVDLARGDGQQSKIAESNEDSGNIADANIGNASFLRNSYLIIRTIIDLSNIDPQLWGNQKDNLIIRYHLTGGLSGDQIYNQDLDDIVSSPNGKTIVITKPIELL
jgi:hypothetical protein